MVKSWCLIIGSFALLLAVAVGPSSADADEGIVIKVAAGKYDRKQTPIRWTLPRSLRGQQQFQLTRLADGQEIAVQVDSVIGTDEQPQLIWMLAKPLANGQTRRYRLEHLKTVKRETVQELSKEAVVCTDDKKQLSIRSGNRPVLVYHQATVLAADRKEAYYDRSGYIHPLFNPAGQPITDDFAPDHPHQHGVMFPWTNTTFEGRKINFWDQKKGQGKVQHARTVQTVSGEVFGGFTAELKHLDMTVPENPKPVLNETWRVRVYQTSDYFLVDLISTQTCASASPLKINDYHYGAMAIRCHRAWLEPGQGDFLTNEGKSRTDGNHSRPSWVDIYGELGGEVSGVAIMSSPRNFRFPQPVRLHPSKPYFSFSPMVLGSFAIEPGKPYVSQYRFYVHQGQIDVEQAEAIWRDYAESPQVTIVP